MHTLEMCFWKYEILFRANLGYCEEENAFSAVGCSFARFDISTSVYIRERWFLKLQIVNRFLDTGWDSQT